MDRWTTPVAGERAATTGQLARPARIWCNFRGGSRSKQAA